MAKPSFLPARPGASLSNGADFVSLDMDQDHRPRAVYAPRTDERRPKRKASAMDEEDTSRRLRRHDRAAPWMSSVNWKQYKTASEMLNIEVEEFLRYITPSPTEHHVRTMIVECIRRAIARRWPSARVLPFGSQETMLYLPDGDIDLVVHYSGVKVDNKDAVVAFLTELSQLLRTAKVSRYITVIARARVPIIKFVTTLGHYAVDISVNQMGGVSAIAAVNRYLHFMPAIRPLVMVVKAFLLQRGLNEPYSGGFGSYTVICMVVSFLQMHPKVRRKEIDPARNLGVMLLDFFELYGRLFNYQEVGISLHDGGSYFSRQKRGWYEHSKMQISVEDPVDATNDIARSSAAGKVRDAFGAAFETLSSAVIIRAQEIASRMPGKRVDLGADPPPNLTSLLSTVVGLSQKMLNFRLEVHELHAGGSLQSFLQVPAAPPPVPPQGQRFVLSSAAASRPQSPSGADGIDRSQSNAEDEDPNEEDEAALLTVHTMDSDSESRYDIGRESRKHRNGDDSVVFVGDEEDGETLSDMSVSPAGDTSPADGKRAAPFALGKVAREVKRAFWQSKNGREGLSADGVESDVDAIED